MSTLLCTISRSALVSASEAKPPLIVNGTTYPYEFGVPVELPAAVVEVARGAGLIVEILRDALESADADAAEEPISPAAESGNGDAAGGDAPGGNPAGSETFDPEAVIKGTVADVTARLAGLTPDQLRAVEAAEIDREQPRKGVADAIAAALNLTQAPADPAQ